ncbi:MAG: ribosome silencing factor [Planctomycetota bacterium]
MKGPILADSRTFCLGILEDMKVQDVVDLPLRSHVLFDRFLVGTCTSSRHLQSTAERLVEEGKKTGLMSQGAEWGATWVAVDFGSLVVHLFLGEVRRRFDLESLWNMERIDFNELEEKLTWPTKS